MIEVFAKEKDNLDQVLKKYKKKLEQLSFIKKRKAKMFFKSKAESRKKEIQRAVSCLRYKRKNGLL